MLKLLLGTDWTANRRVILSRLAQDVHTKQGGRILMVPELISHEMERQLCAAAGDTASRYAEVLSFSRLTRRVAEDMGLTPPECLDAGGRVVAMASAAQQLSSQLKAYAAVETKPEFLTGLIDSIDEFKRCCISPQDLAQAAKETEGSLAQKLEELSLLMLSYDSLCAQGKRDPRDQMTWLLEQLELGSFAREHTFYIDGFPDFTRQNLAILEHLIQESPCVTVSLNCDAIASPLLAFEKAGQTAQELYRSAIKAGIEVQVEQIPADPSPLQPLRQALFQGPIEEGAMGDRVRVFQAGSAYLSCMDAARQVMQWVRSGCRYRDITLVCTDMAQYQPLADLIFQRFHIPLYRSGTEEILQKSVISTVLTALDAAIGGFDQRSTLRYLRSALSPLEPDLCDLVENYAVVWGIRGKKWENPWIWHPDGLAGQWDESSRQRLEEIEQARKTAIAPLSRLGQDFRQARTLSQQVLALYRFLQELALQQRLEQMAQQLDEDGDNRSAQILNQLWEILLSALEQLYDVLGQTHWEAEHFTRLLRLLLSQYKVGTIPPVLDAVQMGPVSAMRCHSQKYLIVLGAEEGSLPGYSGSIGVLTDQERVALRQMGVPLTGGSEEGIQAEFAEIYGVFCGAQEQVRLYYASEQPSFICRRLTQMGGGLSQMGEDLGFAQADRWEAGAYLARWEDEAMAKQLCAQAGYEQTLRQRSFALGKVSRENIRRLYGKTLRLSASQIDRQAECRLSYFLKYGLRAKERKEVRIDPAEFGTYVHAVLEETARAIQEQGGFPQVSLDETMEIAHAFSQRYADQRFSQMESERVVYLFHRNLRELDMVVQELWEELQQSQFRPAAFEVGFGSEGGLPAIAIDNAAMEAVLQGFVDRVDVWNNGGCNYYRVVDYKTGKKDFDYCDVFNGVGLQMLLYLFALGQTGQSLLGERAVPAGVQYFPARAPYITTDGRLEPEDARQERESYWKRKGLLLKDEAVLQAMEPGEHPVRMSYSVKKDGTVSGDLADREQLKQLRRFVFRTVAAMVEDIASGNVEPNPYCRGTSHNACTYCPYDPICHSDQVPGRRNYKRMTEQEFWEELERKENEHG